MPKLLLVDDNEVVEFIVKHILSKEGFEVLTVTQGYEAFDKIITFQPDIILLDNWLPDIMGTALCKAIKLKYDIPIILFSAHDWTESFSSYGADDFINKQFEVEEFVAKVKTNLKKKVH